MMMTCITAARPNLRLLILLGISLVLAPRTPVRAQVSMDPTRTVPPKMTLWRYLGLPDGAKRLRGATTNRSGNRPWREPKVPLKALNDPANLESENAAIKKAAEVKIQEDLKCQKIKAIKYLASIACGCYDNGEQEVSKALAAAMTDCTEQVRLVTVQVIAQSARGKCCNNCGQSCCCNEIILKQLAELAYGRDDKGCYIEASQRVRQAAEAALKACCPSEMPVSELVDGDTPQPSVEPSRVTPEVIPDRVEPETIPDQDEAESDNDLLDSEAAYQPGSSAVAPGLSDVQGIPQPPAWTRRPTSSTRRLEQSLREVWGQADEDTLAPVITGPGLLDQTSRGRSSEQLVHADSAGRPTTEAQPVVGPVAHKAGVVALAHVDSGMAHVHLTGENASVPVGSHVIVMPQDRSVTGYFEVLQSFEGAVNIRALNFDDLDALQEGNSVFLLQE